MGDVVSRSMYAASAAAVTAAHEDGTLSDDDWRTYLDLAEPWGSWSERVFPDLRQSVAPPWHREYTTHVWETSPSYTPAPVAPIFFRGGAKSTLTDRLALGLCLTGRRRFALVVRSDQAAADRAVTGIAASITPHVASMYPWAADPTVSTVTLVRHGVRQSVLNLGGRMTVLGVGLTGGVRGVLVDGRRPDIIALDDLDATADTARTIAAKRAYLLESVLPAEAAGGATVMYAQNLVRPDGLMAEVMRQSPGGPLDGAKIIGPIPMVEDPVIVDGVLTGGRPTWPDRYPIEAAERQRRVFTPAVWARECQHDMTVPIPGALLAPGQFKRVDMPRLDAFDAVVTAVDPSVTTSKSSDSTGIVTVGVRHGAPDVILEDATCDPSTPMDVWVGVVADVVARWGGTVVCEANQGGDAWRLLLDAEFARRDMGDVTVRLVTAVRSKRDRAVPVAARIVAGDLVAGCDVTELDGEWCRWLPGDPSPNRVDAMVWACAAPPPAAVWVRGG